MEHDDRGRGRVTTVPWYVETRLLYYRTDLAEEGGVTEAPRPTWDNLKALAEGIQGAEGAEYGHQPAAGRDRLVADVHAVLLAGRRRDSGRGDGAFALDSEACVEALTFYDSFFEDGLTAPAAARDVSARGPIRQW